MKYAVDFEGYVIIDADSEDDAGQKFLNLFNGNVIKYIEFGHFDVEEDE